MTTPMIVALVLVAIARSAGQGEASEADSGTRMASGEREMAPIPAAQRVVRAWNAALDGHDVAGLNALYADRVLVYGRQLARDEVVASKRTAFSKQPSFRQEIVGDIAVTRDPSGTLIARFGKRSGFGAKLSDVRARLALKPRALEPTMLEVVEESDDATDARLAGKNTSHSQDGGGIGLSSSSCRRVASKAVHALRPVQKAISQAQAAAARSGGGAHYGGITPLDDDSGFTEELGVQTPERFETVVSYAVDRDGKITVTAGGEDVPVPVAGARAVKKACAP